jgi:hypothetical protein
MSAQIDEGIEVRDLPADRRDACVAALHQPWIGDEGPLDADFRQLGDRTKLRPRGLAFDHNTTVLWDEDGVEVARRAAAKEGELAFATAVLVRERFDLSTALYRVDVLRRGVLLASRYTTQQPTERKDHAEP